MFADDTNLFCKNKTIKTLFLKANIDLKKNSEWFQANKLSLNKDKSRFIIFHELQYRDNLPLQQSVLKINNYKIERSSSMKFLRVMVDEHLKWKYHIHIVENKFSKKFGLLHKEKQFLHAKAKKTLYFSFIHSYLTCGHVVRCSTLMNKTKKLFSKQKQTIKIIQIADIHEHLNSDEKMKHLDILNIYKLNFYLVLNIMFQVKTNSIPETLQNIFKVIEHKFSTRHNIYNFKEPNIYLSVTKFSISSGGPRLWKKYTDKLLRTTNLLSLFKVKIKDHLMKLKNISISFE